MVDAAAVGCFDGVFKRHGVRVAEVETFVGFGDDDGGPAVGSEIHVIRVVDRNVLARLAGCRVDRSNAAVGPPFGIIVDPEGFQIPRRHDMLRIDANFIFIDDLQRRLIDHPNVVGGPIGNINSVQVIGDDRAQISRPGLAVEIVGIDNRRHTGNSFYGVCGRRGGNCRRQ